MAFSEPAERPEQDASTTGEGGHEAAVLAGGDVTQDGKGKSEQVGGLWWGPSLSFNLKLYVILGDR